MHEALILFSILEPETIPFMNLIIHGGSFALLVYLLVWGLPKERKEVQDSNSTSLTTVASDNKSNVASMLLAFANQMAAEREMCMEFRKDDLVKHEKIMTLIEQRHADIMQQIALQAKENRHDIKDLAQLLVSHDALVSHALELHIEKNKKDIEGDK
jgi:hypothetical protein